MNLETAIVDDYLVNNLEPEVVEFYPAPRNNSTRFPLAYAERFPLSEADLIQGNGAYTRQDVVWYLWQREITTTAGQSTTFAIKPGDVIDSGDSFSWVVLDVDFEQVAQSWRLTCRNLVLHFGLRDSVTIIRPTIRRGQSAEPVYDYANGTTIVSALVARVQPRTTEVGTTNEVVSAQTHFDVVLGQQVTLQKDDRIEAVITSSGATVRLKWLSQRNAERLDELPVLECVAV